MSAEIFRLRCFVYRVYLLPMAKTNKRLVRMSPWELDQSIYDAAESLRWEKRLTWRATLTAALAAWVVANEVKQENNGGTEEL